jgi:hypothetical protein
MARPMSVSWSSRRAFVAVATSDGRYTAENGGYTPQAKNCCVAANRREGPISTKVQRGN